MKYIRVGTIVDFFDTLDKNEFNSSVRYLQVLAHKMLSIQKLVVD